MAKIILGLTGEKAAGKGTAADHLAEKHGASVHTFSKPMKDCVSRLGLELTRTNLITFSEITRKAYGEDLYARVIAKDSENDDADLVVVDGIRREADIALLKDLPNFHLLYITAPLETRWERAVKRNEKGEGEMTLEQFTEQESAPTEVAIPELGANAAFRIDNTGSFDDLHKNLEDIISKLDSRSGRE